MLSIDNHDALDSVSKVTSLIEDVVDLEKDLWNEMNFMGWTA